MITLNEYLAGRDKKFPDEYTDEIHKNSLMTIARASEILSSFGKKRKVTSGWRPMNINKLVGGAPKSLHIYGLAIDLEDGDGELKKWCVTNIERLVEIGLWMESPLATIGWCHLQCKPPRSKNRIFVP